VVERLETAFHPEFATVMIRAANEPEYHRLVAAPRGQGLASLPAEAKFMGLLRVLGKPLEVHAGDSNWLERQLPGAEASLLRQERIDLLVPIVAASNREEALLVLGSKRSEEPYTREDIEFLEAISAGLSFLIDRPPPANGTALRPVEDSRNLQECPQCGACYESTSTNCSVDGTNLVSAGVPRMLAGRYQLERHRGHGGMGTVYEASDSELERRVAVKLIREEWSGSVDALQRFHREARAAAGFSHPNVVTVHDYGVDEQRRAFLVMELLEGVTLRDELRRNGALPPSRVVEILRGVCGAVQAAHQQQLIHRDLKPGNIFLAQGKDGSGEVVKVLDFGVAKFLPVIDDATPTRTRAETNSGVLVGTPAYMSPEQLLGGNLHKQWDLWALAVVAYEVLTGALPFDTSEPDWQRSVISGKFTPPSAYRAEAPGSWESFFRRCFSTDRGERPATAAEFFEQLESALS
jgi:hypothetical protein